MTLGSLSKAPHTLRPASFLFLSLLLATCTTFSQESDYKNFSENLGGDLSSDLQGADAIQVTAPNVLEPELISKQLMGFGTFHKTFSKREGLGPYFVNKACRSCHVENGKGPVRLRHSRPNTMVVKVNFGLEPDGSARAVPGVGTQIKTALKRSNRQKDPKASLQWRRIRGKYPDGTRFELRKPELLLDIPSIKRRSPRASLRMSPLLVGMGLLEAIPESSILALADPDDIDQDGISGRPNFVNDLVNQGVALGRFGFKATHPSLLQQNSQAAFQDMGISNSIAEPESTNEEISRAELDILTIYLALAGVPKAREVTAPRVAFGFRLFQDIGCDKCHVPSFETTAEKNAPLDRQTIYPFTDLLLHDMGPELADNLAEFEAAPSEWRTTPLWGLGFAKQLSKVKPRYLHDGRARTVEEAILWHGGEGEAARDAFKQLPALKREILLSFLDSL